MTTDFAWIFLLFSPFINSEKTPVHDFHVSQALINYNVDNRTYEVSLHIFIDDLELALSNTGVEKLYIATNKEDENADEYIFKYLTDRFSIISDRERVELSFLGKETSHDLMAVWCYLEAIGIPKPKEVTITNSILIEVYNDQKNLITFTYAGVAKYLLFDKRNVNSRVRLR